MVDELEILVVFAKYISGLLQSRDLRREACFGIWRGGESLCNFLIGIFAKASDLYKAVVRYVV